MIKVLIAGIAGASLGTEILKSLMLAGRYTVYGCDISNLAYGHYQGGFEKTFIINENTYLKDIIDICRNEDIRYIIPGGEEPMVLLDKARDELKLNGLTFVGNAPEVISVFSNKEKTFKVLEKLGFAIPHTIKVKKREDLERVQYPAVIKPSTGSGGSSFVFFIQNPEETAIYLEYLQKNKKDPIIQEYIPEDEGEYTVGVLNLPDGALVGSIALKRVFSSKLSVMAKLKGGIISSGNSQGMIDSFPNVERTAVDIAASIKSKGPINIQGRVKNGIFMPFEINPRFSASTYLRAMAGFNEIDLFISAITTGKCALIEEIKHGYYLRSFTETFISKDKLIND